mgnify:FL=1
MSNNFYKTAEVNQKKEILLGSVSDDEAKNVRYYLMGQVGCYSRAMKHIFRLFIMVYMWS